MPSASQRGGGDLVATGRSVALLLFSTSLLFTGCVGDSEDENDEVDKDECGGTSTTLLESVKVGAGPALDGIAEAAAWDCAPSLSILVNANAVYTPEGAPTAPSYPGLTETTVTAKSVWTDTDVYFLFTWADPSKSLARYPWQKNADGSWQQLMNKDSTGHENTFYEDKFGVQWNINNESFQSQGCYASCHSVADPASDLFPGKKYNSVEGQLADMWHWKSVRTEPNGQLDDKHIIYQDPTNPSDPEHFGRQSDTKDGGGYIDNNFGKYADACAGNPDGTLSLPCFMGPAGTETILGDDYWIFDNQKQNFVDSFVSGEQIAGMITSPLIGSSGDVTTVANYEGGAWTLEVKRSLTTSAGTAEDVQFNDLSATYHFGVAVFDNTQINHAVHAGSLEFKFKQ